MFSYSYVGPFSASFYYCCFNIYAYVLICDLDKRAAVCNKKTAISPTNKQQKTTFKKTRLICVSSFAVELFLRNFKINYSTFLVFLLLYHIFFFLILLATFKTFQNNENNYEDFFHFFLSFLF